MIPFILHYSCCRDCTKLAIEVTYPMKDLNLYTLRRTYNQYETEGPAREDWEPFEWMKALESLVLIKLGGLDTKCVHILLLSVYQLICLTLHFHISFIVKMAG